MLRAACIGAIGLVAGADAFAAETPAAKTSTREVVKPAATAPLEIGQQAPAFAIDDANGQVIDLQQLCAQGPVLVRLTCGCSGCDEELAYFQTLHEAYKDKGLTSLAVFKEPDTKVEQYVKEKKLKMLYAVDSEGSSWNTFHTTTMPADFLIKEGARSRRSRRVATPTG